MKASLILFPSNFFRDLGVANGLRPGAASPTRMACFRQARATAAPKVRPCASDLSVVPVPTRARDRFSRPSAPSNAPTTNWSLLTLPRMSGEAGATKQTGRCPAHCGFIRVIPKRSIDEFFSSIDVLLFPSLWKESFGSTVREALVRDVWVIASDAGELPKTAWMASMRQSSP